MDLRDWSRIQNDKLVDLGLTRILRLNSAACFLIEGSPNVTPEPEDEELYEGPKGVQEHDLEKDWCDVLEPL